MHRWLLAGLAMLGPAGATASTQALHYGLFGDLRIARAPATPAATVFFVSDGNGWDGREEGYAAAFAAAGNLVVGLDLPTYLRELGSIQTDCALPYAHVEEVSHWVQRHEQLDAYSAPWLVGLDSGATLAYAVAAQAPAGTFAGLTTLGFDFRLRLTQPLCVGDAGSASVADADAGYQVVPVTLLPLPWLALPYAAGSSINGIGEPIGQMLAWTRLQTADATPPAPAVAARWQRWRQREAQRREALPQDVADLPLTEIPAQGAAAERIAIVLSGDGGWAGLDQGVADTLAASGVQVVGFSTLKFFWHTRTPDEAAAAVARVIGHYAAQRPTARFALVGYSFGASLAPVVLNRLPAAARAKVAAQFLISPDAAAVFEIKVGDWFGGAQHEGSLPVAPEIARSAIPTFCIHGSDEEGSVCTTLSGDGVQALALPGGHHYDGDYPALGRLILTHWP